MTKEGARQGQTKHETVNKDGQGQAGYGQDGALSSTHIR